MKRYRTKSSDDLQQQASLALIEGQSQSQSTEVLQEDDNLHTNETTKKIDGDPEVSENVNGSNIGGNAAETTAFTISSNHALSVNTSATVSPDKSSSGATTATANNGSAGHKQSSTEQPNCCSTPKSTTATISTIQQKMQQQSADKQMKRDLKKESLEAKRERKAAKTLAIITGAFVVCWLPFFIMALLMPLCDACYISDYLASFFLWLGYFNSTLNPVIYTIFSPEFRQAFKRMLCGVSHARNRGRKLR